MGIKLYFHPQSPPAQVAWMVLKELGVEYEEIEMNLWDGNVDKTEILSVNPHGKVPAIKDGDFCLGESRAIAIYLCQKYEKCDKENKLYPKDIETSSKMNMELFSDLDNFVTIQKYLNVNDVFTGKSKGPFPEHLEAVKKHLTQVDSVLAKQKYLFCDHMTILDICKLNMMGLLDMAKFDSWDEFPNIVAWKQRMSQLPYYDQCHTKGFEFNIQYYAGMNAKFDPKNN